MVLTLASAFTSMIPDLRVHAGGWGWRLKIRTLFTVFTVF